MNDNFNSLSPNRLKSERIRLGLNQAEAADLCGISREMWGKYERGVAVPGGEVLFSFAAAGADVQYILTGQQITQPVIKNQYQKVSHHDPVYRSDEYVEIPHYDVQVGAGSGALPHAEDLLKPLAFRRDWLAARHLSATNLVIVDVKGESMEPKLQDGDLVLVDKSQTDIASGKTYVLRMDGHLLVKNLQLIPHGLIQVSSFNTGFSSYEANLSDESVDITIIGRVVASMHEW